MSPATSRRSSGGHGLQAAAGSAVGFHPTLLRLVRAVHLDQDPLPAHRQRPAGPARRPGPADPPSESGRTAPPPAGPCSAAGCRSGARRPAAEPAASCLATASCTRFSPTSSGRRAAAARTASGPWVLVTATMRTGWVHPPTAWCRGHGFTYPGQPAGQVREVHSLEIYADRARDVGRSLLGEAGTSRRGGPPGGRGWGESLRHTRRARSMAFAVAAVLVGVRPTGPAAGPGAGDALAWARGRVSPALQQVRVAIRLPHQALGDRDVERRAGQTTKVELGRAS